MPLNVGIWRVDGGLRSVPSSGMPNEERLESLIEADPWILGTPLLVIGRQVQTAHGKRVDLLGLDADGAVHVLELKKDRTPRDVIAQLLDYGSWAQRLSHDDITAIHQDYRPEVALEVAFDEAFGLPLPDELGSGHTLTVVAADIDPESQRIVEYLASFDIPVNVVFFRYFVDGDREYLARTWLIDQPVDAAPRARGKGMETWTGIDWYVSFGQEPGGRSWEDARAHGFVSAGGGDWYTRTLQVIPIGARIWAYIPRAGYVGVGTATGEATPISKSSLDLASFEGTYVGDGDECEWAIPVEWLRTFPRQQAVFETGMFISGNPACRLRSQFTLDRLHHAFDIDPSANPSTN